MRQGVWFAPAHWGAAITLMLLGVATTWADTPADWLMRAAAASKAHNYSGIYVYHHGEHVEVLRVLHRSDARGEQEKTEVLDGTPRRFLRVNNDVYCHMPDGRNVRLERNTTRRFFPALLPADPRGLLAHYDARLGGSERVAGRGTQVLSLVPRDAYRHTMQLWLDRRTGLPLKARVVNENGVQVTMFVFSEVQIGQAPDERLFRNDLTGKRIVQASLDAPMDTGWVVRPPPGFNKVQEAMRAMPGRAVPVAHLVFSDGLAVISMFIEPAEADTQARQGLSTEGVIGVYTRLVDGHLVTTVGEVPAVALIETGNSVRRQ